MKSRHTRQSRSSSTAFVHEPLRRVNASLPLESCRPEPVEGSLRLLVVRRSPDRALDSSTPSASPLAPWGERVRVRGFYISVSGRSTPLREQIRNCHSGHFEIGTKNPFSGQPNNQSTRPSFGRGRRRTSRYSPQSTRSTSNSCPGSMPSSRRILAGNIIRPRVETVIVTAG